MCILNIETQSFFFFWTGVYKHVKLVTFSNLRIWKKNYDDSSCNICICRYSITFEILWFSFPKKIWLIIQVITGTWLARHPLGSQLPPIWTFLAPPLLIFRMLYILEVGHGDKFQIESIIMKDRMIGFKYIFFV